MHAPVCTASLSMKSAPRFHVQNSAPCSSINEWFCGRRPRRKNGLMRCVLPPCLLAARIHHKAASLARSVHVADLATMSPR